MKKSMVLIVCILVILELFALYKLNQNKYNKKIMIIEKEYIGNINNNNVWEDKISFTIEPTYNPIDKYSKEKLNVRESVNGKIVDVLNINDKVIQLKELSCGWSVIKYNNKERFVKSEYLIDKPIVIEKPLILENVEIEQNQLYQGNLIGYFKITHYCSCRKCNGSYAPGATASGKPMKVGITVASNSIKLGTKIIIDGHQYEVQDTGGMANNVIDIYVNSHSEAMQKGVRHNVPVYYCQ